MSLITPAPPKIIPQEMLMTYSSSHGTMSLDHYVHHTYVRSMVDLLPGITFITSNVQKVSGLLPK